MIARFVWLAFPRRDQLVSDAAKIGLGRGSGGAGAGVGSGKRRVELSLDDRIKRAVAAGLFVNAAHRCAQETIFRSMPMPAMDIDMTSTGEGPVGGRRAGGAGVQGVSLYHVHPTSSLSSQGAPDPPEYVVFQELVSGGRLYMRHVTGVDVRDVQRHRAEWHAVHPLVLCGRKAVSVVQSGEVVEGVEGGPSQGRTGKRPRGEGAEGPSTADGESKPDLPPPKLVDAKARYLARKMGK